MTRNENVSADRIRELMSYDPDTGFLTWKVKRNSFRGCVVPGAIAGSIASNGYVDIRIDGKLFKAHRLIWLIIYGEWPKTDIDHINGMRTDNRLCNLRLATRSQNNANGKLSKLNKSGFRGVSLHNSGKWTARIRDGEKYAHLGLFASKEEAALAYQKRAKQIFGEYARPVS